MTHEEWPRRVAALGQFRVSDVARPSLDPASDHHLRTVLRARVDEEVVVTDGAGAWALCRVAASSLDAVSDVRHDRPGPETTLYLSPLKGDRAQWAVAKATEVGITRIVPLASARTVVALRGDARAKTVVRWRRVALEAAAQCRRTYDVTIDEPVAPSAVPENVAVADMNGDGNWSGVRAVAVGPEGGWTCEEWAPSRRRLALGPTVLRAETAGVVAAALMAFHAGDWGFTFDGAK